MHPKDRRPLEKKESMDKVVNIRERLERKKQKKRREQDREKLEAIQKLIQCTSCHLRCAMCGLYIKESNASNEPGSTYGYTFCKNCKGEFDAFLSVSRGERSDVIWHNKEWINMWSAWLNYRKAVTAFMDSPEFKLLTE